MSAGGMLMLLSFLFSPFAAARGLLNREKRARTGSDAGLTRACLHYARMDEAALMRHFASHPAGLTSGEVANSRARHGLNQVASGRPTPWWRYLVRSYVNPFNLLLTVLAAISWATDDLSATAIISLMVLISTLLNGIQELRSSRAAQALKAMVSSYATVLRTLNDRGESGYVTIPVEELVPGDIVKLVAGDIVPADLRLLSCRALFVSQATLTGESLPVEKTAQPGYSTRNPLESGNLCFMGTSVASGSARALVVATGEDTWFGQLAGQTLGKEPEPNAFRQGISRVSLLLIRFMLVMAPVVLLINGFTKGDWWDAALFALSVAVGLTPEMLPMIVTSTLARGAIKLSRQKVIVKRLDAIQNFGAMDILCTDKTGTLTRDRIRLEGHICISGETSQRILEMAWLNSSYQTGLNSPLDEAVKEKVAPVRGDKITSRWRKVDEVPFDFSRRRMTVVVSQTPDSHWVICKGALEEVLNVCTRMHQGSEVITLDAALRASVRQKAERLNREGLRVVAVAGKQVPVRDSEYGRADESDLILEGFLTFLDPPKETTAPALRALQDGGVAIKILTGDSELVAAKVCREVGLEPGEALTGSQIAEMDDTSLAARARECVLFARLTPLQKSRVVRLLREQGHVVGFMGDGINDAPALRVADIGISVDSAVDIAREAADIILLEKSLMVLEEGVREGRRTFANMLKYIRMTASSNFGNVFSVLVASAFLPFLPMLPLHLLIQNLLYDISQVAIPFDNVDEEQVARPQRWDPAQIGRFMLFFGPVSSIFDILTFCLMWWVFQANVPEAQTLFQSGWFVVGLLSQTLIVHLIRTRRLPFLQSRAAWPLMAMTLVVMVLGILLPFSPWAGCLHLQALPLSYFPWLAAILVGYMALTQAVKGFYSRRYGWQ
ncbi:magnesium-translocating P-type ATPase [Erwinia sp. CPCC 100877]|nr:magnesium-translocating P-type ATPase [Erwinia sp. CPCC 100877]